MASGRNGKVLELVEAVEGSKEFIAWRKSNKGAYISSLFTMGSSVEKLGELDEWLLSYYDGKNDTFTTFSSTGSKAATKEQAFKKGKGRTLPQLKTKAVKVEVWLGMKTAEDLRTTKYKGEEPSKVIAILQPLTHEEIFAAVSNGGTLKKRKRKRNAAQAAKPVWNITYITTSYNVLNVKIDAETGGVLNHRISGVMDFVQKDK